MSHIIDRRPTGSTGAASKERLIKRVKEQLKEAVKKSIGNESIEDLINKGRKVTIPDKTLSEPTAQRDWRAGDWQKVFPGNKEYHKGDSINKPDDDGGAGQDGSPTGENDGLLSIYLSPEEYLSLLFEGLELPSLDKKSDADIEQFINKRAGFVKEGSPNRLNLIRTLRTSLGRKISLNGELKEELNYLKSVTPITIEIAERIIEIEEKISKISFLDETDMRYNHFVQVPQPKFKAVMFCLMDVSGSMGETEIQLSKRFMVLTYLFLARMYKEVEMVFVVYDTRARQVEQSEFFSYNSGGGTLTSAGLLEVQRIWNSNYDHAAINSYLVHASDGDNYSGDSEDCLDILDDLTSTMQNIFYVEVNRSLPNTLYKTYGILESANISRGRILSTEGVYPVFRDMFTPATKKQK